MRPDPERRRRGIMTCRRASNWMTLMVLGAVLISGLLMTGGCTAMQSSLKSSPELLLSLEGKGLDPAFAYYYCGRSNLPYAVVGIDRAYTFKSRFWFQIGSMDEVYHKIAHLANLERGQHTRYARQILAPDGGVAGTYFSFYHATPVSVDETAKTVWVSNPYTPTRCQKNFNPGSGRLGTFDQGEDLKGLFKEF